MKPSQRTKAGTRTTRPLDKHLLELFVQFEADTIAAYQKSLCNILRKETDPIWAENRRKLLEAVRAAFKREVRDV